MQQKRSSTLASIALNAKNMFYHEAASLVPEIESRWATISKGPGNSGKNPKDSAKLVWSVYRNTYKSELPFILLGPNQIRETFKEEFGLVEISKKPTNGGSILAGQWSYFINYMFLLGAIHARKEVHTTMTHIPRFIELWDAKRNAPTALAREIVILKLAGYTKADTNQEDYGISFEPSCKDLSPLKLASIFNTLENIKTPTDLKNALLD